MKCNHYLNGSSKYSRALRQLGLAAVVLVLAPISSFGQAANQPDGRPIEPAGGVPLGVYDPNATFSTDTDVSVEHLFLPWEDVDLSTLAIADDYARSRDRTLLVTIEPWTWSTEKRTLSSVLLQGILDGAYDSNIAAVCGELGKFSTPTTIRWAQEMEDNTGRFPWASWAPEDYKVAYRKFVSECRALAPNAKFMWSPLGQDNLADYYPGDDVVDEVGLTVFGLQKYDNDKFGHDRTFAEILKPGYDLALQFKKPIYVAELGYVGSADYVANWARDTLQPDPAFPELTGASYFNDKEVSPWPEDYGLPDWRVTENVVN